MELRSWIDQRPESAAYLVAGAVVLASLFWRVWLLQVRYIDSDEFTHLHASWSLVHGLLPYRDFFETHPPAFYFLLAPAFRLFDVTTSGGAGSMLFFARWMMLAVSGLILLETFWLGRRWREARVGAVGAALLATTFVFQQKTLEVRPDVPATALLLGCLLIVTGPGSPSAARIRSLTARMFLSGALMSLAFLFTTKVVFAVPGLAVAILLSARDPDRKDQRFAFRSTVWFAAGFGFPILITCAYFLTQGGLGALITDLVVLPLRWRTRIPLGPYIRLITRANSILVVLGVIGGIQLLRVVAKERARGRGNAIVALTALSLIAGLLVNPATLYQYYLYFLPLLALYAAWMVVGLGDRAFARRRSAKRVRWATSVIVVSAVALAVLTWLTFHTNSFYWNMTLNPSPADLAEFLPLFTAAAVVLWLGARLGAGRGVALAAALTVLSVVPLHRQIAWPLQACDNGIRICDLRGDNTAQVRAIEYVARASTATDAVLDGFSGAGVFRPQAFYYGFLTSDVAAMVPENERSGLLQNLRSGRLAPKIIALDPQLQLFLGPEGVRFIHERYIPSSVRPLFVRR